MATESSDGDPFDACDHCGRRFERGVRYPVETRTEPDGSLGLYSFCDEACRAAWSDDD